jgi:opacity protein-like surface antigen
MKIKTILLSAFVAVLASSAYAADNSSANYMGLTLGQSQMDAGGLSGSTGNAFGVFVGHDFNKNFGIEAAYNGLGNFSGYGISGHSTEADVSAIGTYYLDGSNTVGLYGKVGIDHTWVNAYGVTDSETGMTYGLGMRYKVTSHIEGRFGLQYYGIGGSNAYYNHETAWSLGAAYRF